MVYISKTKRIFDWAREVLLQLYLRRSIMSKVSNERDFQINLQQLWPSFICLTTTKCLSSSVNASHSKIDQVRTNNFQRRGPPPPSHPPLEQVYIHTQVFRVPTPLYLHPCPDKNHNSQSFHFLASNGNGFHPESPQISHQKDPLGIRLNYYISCYCPGLNFHDNLFSPPAIEIKTTKFMATYLTSSNVRQLYHGNLFFFTTWRLRINSKTGWTDLHKNCCTWRMAVWEHGVESDKKLLPILMGFRFQLLLFRWTNKLTRKR